MPSALATTGSLADNPPTSKQPAGRVTKDTIERAWRRVGARLHSARFEFTTRTITDSQALKTFEESVTVKTRTKPVDDKRVEYQRLTRVSIDGLRMRWELLAKDEPNTALRRICIEVSNGVGNKSLTMPSELSTLSYPGGEVLKSPVISSVLLIDTLPIFMVMSRLIPAINAAEGHDLDLERYKIADSPGLLNDKECVILHCGDRNARRLVWQKDGQTYTDGIDGIYRQLWLDPSKEYAIVRYRNFVNGKLKHQIDIDYHSDSGSHWVPQSWTMTLPGRSDGAFTEIRQSKVLKWESNPQFAASEFDFDFPPGTMVSDQTSPRAEPRTGIKAYLVKPDGSKRPVSFQESIHRSYEELLHSDPPAP